MQIKAYRQIIQQQTGYKMSKKEYISGFIWEAGNRVPNEDAICLYDIKYNGIPIVLGIVCDGISGLSEGALSSTYTVTKMQKEVLNIAKQYLYYHGIISMKKMVSRKLYMNHTELLTLSKRMGIKTGTTISMLIIINNKYFIFHIGDSRIYGIKHQKVSLYTKDDTDRNHILHHALGVGSYKKPLFKKGVIRKGQVFILCTDGFYRRNDMQKSFAHLSLCEEKINPYLATISRRLIEIGEKDNISAVYIKRIL